MALTGTAANRREYERRINRVMDYVSQNLSEPLALESLAAVAAFSPFHFHRVFKSHTGESLGNFIQRIRLERAARALIHQTGRDITDIALEAGFASSSAFAHAFKTHFGMSATRWREEGSDDLGAIRRRQYSNLNQAHGKPKQAENGATPQNQSQETLSEETLSQETKKMNVGVKELPDFHVAYMRNIGPYGPTQIPPLWQKLMTWAQARGLATPETLTLGISYDDPEVTPPEKCRYDACIVVPRDFRPEPAVNVKDIPGGKYAVYEFVGTSAQIMEPWRRIFSEWLPSSGYQPDDRPCYELYRADCYIDKSNGVFRCDLCVPVKPL